MVPMSNLIELSSDSNLIQGFVAKIENNLERERTNRTEEELLEEFQGKRGRLSCG